MVVPNAPRLTRYCQGVSPGLQHLRYPFPSVQVRLSGPLIPLLGQVVEAEGEVVNIRETDGRLGPLIFTLLALGIAALLGTVAFWWLTRPNRLKE